jgi:3-oxochol-4-en-24-oyl-CoA dehydrogenase
MSAPAPHEELRAVLDEVLPPYRARWGMSTEWGALLDFQCQLGARGWTAPAWPAELGGRGLDLDQQLACERVFFELDAPMRVAVFGVNNVGPTIAAYGTADQRRHLQAIVKVDELWCQGFSEPDAGSDLAGLRTRAERVDGGFVINGQKVWTSIGLHASHCMLLARTDPAAPKHKDISALLIPLDLPGITRRPITMINGHQEFAELFFDDVRVPATALLGPLHDGWRVTMTTLGYERAGVLSMAGRLAVVTERTVRRLAAQGALAGPALDRAMRLYSRAQLLNMTGQRALASERGAPGALSTIIKLAWSKLIQDVEEFGIDARGTLGVAGTDLSDALRFVRSRSSSIAGGTTEVLKNLVGERVLGLPKEPALD